MSNGIVPKLEKGITKQQWFKLEGGTVFKNIGFSSYRLYSDRIKPNEC